MDERRVRILCAGFFGALALLAPVRGAFAATPIVVAGPDARSPARQVRTRSSARPAAT